MISDDKVEKALDYLNDNVGDASVAKANRVYMEKYEKALIADIMKEKCKENPSLPLAAQEREALADPRYKIHLNGMKEAVRDDEWHRGKRISAEVVIQAWQTQSANHRGAERLR